MARKSGSGRHPRYRFRIHAARPPVTHKIEENIDRERDKIVHDFEFTTCADVADYVERPHVPQFTHNATGDPMETDARIAVVHMNECNAPHVTKWVGEPLPVHGNPFQRLVRRQILSIRSDFYRQNPYFRSYEGARWLVTAIRDHRHRNDPENRPEPPSSDPASAGLLSRALNSSWGTLDLLQRTGVTFLNSPHSNRMRTSSPIFAMAPAAPARLPPLPRSRFARWPWDRSQHRHFLHARCRRSPPAALSRSRSGRDGVGGRSSRRIPAQYACPRQLFRLEGAEPRLHRYGRGPLPGHGRYRRRRCLSNSRVKRSPPNFFSVLGVAPMIGRTFSEEEDRAGAQVVVISYGLWQRRYLGDAARIKQPIHAGRDKILSDRRHAARFRVSGS